MGAEIGEVVEGACSGGNVRRRRRAEAMCSCRRRSSGKTYDGGWACQNDKMVQQKPRYTNPVWSEEFNDERGDGSLNESRWVLTYSGSGNGNNEKQFYTQRQDNLHIEGGLLKITGKREDFDGKGYTSGKITTMGKASWGPGTRIEVRAKLPVGVGTWPAIWMMPEKSSYGNWPDSGEIDIMEANGRAHGKVFGTIHTRAYNHMKGTQKGKSFYTDFSEWHTYALHWEEDKLTWYTDGNLYNTFEPYNLNDYAEWPFNRPFYLILNLALGGNLGGGIRFSDDQVMEVDYVRVFCLDGSTNCEAEQISCCDKCQGHSYCSPKSFNCYDEKRSSYYETCEVEAPALPVPTPAPSGDSDGKCCGSCNGAYPFCSPNSGNCYSSKSKDYYVGCTTTTTTPCVGSECHAANASNLLAQEMVRGCCGSCGDKGGFCSPKSGSCYDSKKKDYYEVCGEPRPPQCCTDCAGKLGFYSPSSGRCYKTQAKDYYQECPEVDSNAEKGECKVGGDEWCAATVPDANLGLRSCTSLGMRVKALTYNLFWWNLFGQRGGAGGSAGKLVKSAAEGDSFDVVGFQECDDPNWIMGDAGMTTEEYDYVRWGSNTLAFKRTRFEKQAQGDGEFVAQDFGAYSYRRGAHWVRLQEKATGNKLFVMNHHGPLPVNTGGRCGGEATAYNLLAMIKKYSEPGDALLFMGDFNADGGSETVKSLQGYMDHVFNDWVDNFFSNCGGDAVKETKNLGKGGSDHNALMTIIEY